MSGSTNKSIFFAKFRHSNSTMILYDKASLILGTFDGFITLGLFMTDSDELYKLRWQFSPNTSDRT